MTSGRETTRLRLPSESQKRGVLNSLLLTMRVRTNRSLHDRRLNIRRLVKLC